MTRENLRKLILFSIFAAIIIILGMTPLGIIVIPGLLSATLLHIPVIIGGCVLGWKYGAGLGFLFGMVSFIKNSFMPTSATAYFFTPLLSGGNVWSVVICFVPRILIGVVAALVFAALMKKNKILACVVASIAGSLTNTVLVLSGISIFFGNVNEIFGKIIKTAISINGGLEILAAVVLNVAIISVLSKLKVFKVNNAA